MSRLNRLFDLLQSLRNLPGPVTAQQLADETGVSQRTIYRDIETLRGVGAIIDGSAGYGYVLCEDASLPPFSFDDEEIEALVLGLREVSEIGDSELSKAANSALSKLAARLPDEQTRRMKHAVLSAKRFADFPVINVDCKALRDACWHENEVKFEYCDSDQARTKRIVKPLAITFMDYATCLIAYCNLRSDFRAFRLDRMGKLEICKTSFRPMRAQMLKEAMRKFKIQRNSEYQKKAGPDGPA